ncbi:MAG: 2-isopropylmalate synthase [Prevotella sp.]|jgi:D-citramalate synthase|uniref:alpha-isopropylmalate synthase regulatory domain-containing protein n=1 Tax=unclassified Dysgonomonas TaxID=2630389 RepID=UPI0025C07246|nr:MULTISPECIES: alpha-isopropylmalate synthase regulatory domain-containing protein [unclassified Dysgonomonas]MDR1715505.1 2-isopropylmalate synthase [Prevotella sp.]MDR2002635.1 2-isopropylmalate synthase [Prevotella sp.]HMM04752.1 alpha-isopropylmalate synthase regulatory domain-containing protein [Dysgonomonas sp.]
MIEIMDTTLRDGEQTSTVSFSAQEKMSIAHLLLVDLGVNRIEVASARVSNGEFETVKKIASWAKATGHIDKIEILGFIDKGASINWIKDAGCRTINLLTKGSYKHVTEQLRKTPEQHLEDIRYEVGLAEKMGITVNVYLEDWSNGIMNSEDYVYFMMDGMKDLPIRRFMLPDTLGVLNPHSVWRCCRRMINRYPNLHFDFHAHNDYDLAVANTMVAAEVGVKGVHVTMNGLGERAGNASLSSVIAVFHDQLKLETSIKEDKLNKVSRVVESYSGINIAANQPIVGDNVFTQCAGIHADGDNKNNLYYNDLFPERFGRVREYALGKLSGKSNIRKNIEALGIELDEEDMMKVTNRVIELGDKKEIITQDDLPYIISDVLKNNEKEKRIKILSFAFLLTKGLRPTATVRIEIDGQEHEWTAPGDGQYHAFSKALWKIYSRLNKPTPTLTNYAVYIPPGGRTDALVQTVITWEFNGKSFKTRGLDADQTEAAVKATEKMLNMIEDM